MITLTTGLPGHGKSLYTIWYVKQLAEREQRPVFYSGIKDLKLPWIEIDPEKWYECPVGAIIVIDECQRIFRPRGSAAKVPEYVSRLETHRHDGHDIFLITQHPGLVDGNVRKLTEKHMHVSRRFGMQRAVIFEYQSIREQPLKATADAIRIDWKYPKEVFDYYHSSEMHTVKKRIPVQYIVMFIAPVLALSGAGYFVYSHMLDGQVVINKEQAKSLKTENPVSSGSAPLGAPSQSSKLKEKTYMKVDEFVDYSNPRIPGLPHTAPKYDEVTRPVRAPYPAACIVYKGKCKCYTDKGTFLETGEQMCYEVMEKGFYVDWNTSPNQGGSAVAQRPDAPAQGGAMNPAQIQNPPINQQMQIPIQQLR